MCTYCPILLSDVSRTAAALLRIVADGHPLARHHVTATDSPALHTVSNPSADTSLACSASLEMDPASSEAQSPKASLGIASGCIRPAKLMAD